MQLLTHHRLAMCDVLILSGDEKCVVVINKLFCMVTSGTVEDYGRFMQV